MTATEIEVVELQDLDFELPCLGCEKRPGVWLAMRPCAHTKGPLCDPCLDHWMNHMVEEVWLCLHCDEPFRRRDVKLLGPL